MSITHIPPNDWAAVGARLERYIAVELFQRADDTYHAYIRIHEGPWFDGKGKTQLAALTAALDAAEGKSSSTNDPT